MTTLGVAAMPSQPLAVVLCAEAVVVVVVVDWAMQCVIVMLARSISSSVAVARTVLSSPSPSSHRSLAPHWAAVSSRPC